jgi:hypothetical protein
MQHLALNVSSIDDVLTMRDRIRSHGIQVMGPIDHGMIQSIYFAGPEGLSLEVCTGRSTSTSDNGSTPRSRRSAAISADELERLTVERARVVGGQPDVDAGERHEQQDQRDHERFDATQRRELGTRDCPQLDDAHHCQRRHRSEHDEPELRHRHPIERQHEIRADEEHELPARSASQRADRPLAPLFRRHRLERQTTALHLGQIHPISVRVLVLPRRERHGVLSRLTRHGVTV